MVLPFTLKAALTAALFAALTGQWDLFRSAVQAPLALPKLSIQQATALKCHCCGRGGLDAAFLRRVLRLQQMWGHELVFTSGFRCPPHNVRVGGVGRSKHLFGLAADVAVPSRRQKDFCRRARKLGFAKVLPDASRGYVHISM